MDATQRAKHEQHFLEDIGRHQMTVIQDSEERRHLRFKSPGTTINYFDLITWAGHLCFTGDHGTYVFSRVQDMFEFFRSTRKYALAAPLTLDINPPYWSEKVLSQDVHGKVEEYSPAMFRRNVQEYFNNRFADQIAETADLTCAQQEGVAGDEFDQSDIDRITTHAEKRAAIWSEIEDDVLSQADYEHRAQDAAHEFIHDGFEFVDFHEYRCRDYSARFIWCCHALVWGIAQYDAHKAPKVDTKTGDLFEGKEAGHG